MDKAELKSRLTKEGVRSDCYDLNDSGKDEAFHLTRRGPLWAVFYSERGRESGLMLFNYESEACEYLFHALTS